MQHVATAYGVVQRPPPWSVACMYAAPLVSGVRRRADL